MALNRMQLFCPIFSTPPVQFTKAIRTRAAHDSPQVVGPLLSCDRLRRREAKSMPPVLVSPRSPNRGELFFQRAREQMMARMRSEAAPISWLHVTGMIVVLWAVSSETFAQVREATVAELRGTAVRGNAAPLRNLDTVKAGERLRLSSGSQVSLFTSEDGKLYVIDGPADVLLTAQGVMANGKLAATHKLSEAYRNVKVGGAEMVQGSMVMRTGGGSRLRGPEGVVSAEAARTFSWTPVAGSVRLELATHSGDGVYRAVARDGVLTLPAEVRLVPGERYVWGIFAEGNAAAPLDWTEFSVASSADAQGPGVPESAAERVLHAAWLSSRGLERAASRTLQSGRD